MLDPDDDGVIDPVLFAVHAQIVVDLAAAENDAIDVAWDAGAVLVVKNLLKMGARCQVGNWGGALGKP